MTIRSMQVSTRHAARGANLLRRLGRTVRSYLEAYRQAKAAEELYSSLARASDQALARRGTTRQRLLSQVRKRLDLPA